jgi:uncharacterized membrane protein YphA (DoxX/SURF4 family)
MVECMGGSSEDDLLTFDGFLEHQGFDPASLSPEELAAWRQIFDDATARSASIPKVGLMKLRPIVGEHRYAVAVRDGSDLWLVLWVRRSRKGEFFVMVPRGDRKWDVHTSYHLDGTFRMKSYGHAMIEQQRQPLTGTFRGTESLGLNSGYGPRSVGAICDPTAFAGVVEVGAGVLGPKHGVIAVDLVEPGCEPIEMPFTTIVKFDTFRDAVPWVVIRVGSQQDLVSLKTDVNRSRWHSVLIVVLRLVITLLFAGAIIPKLRNPVEWGLLFASWGYPPWGSTVVSVIEIIGLAVLWIPAFATWGAAALMLTTAGAMGTWLIHGPRVVAIYPGTLFVLVGWLARLQRRKTGRPSQAGHPQTVAN